MGRVTVSVAGQTAHADYTVAATPGPLMGADWSTANPPEPNYFEGKWGAYRPYTRSQAIAAWNAATIKPGVVIVSDDQALPVSNPQAAADAFRAFMASWNSAPARVACRVVWVWRNEIFNEYTGAVPANVVTGFRLASVVAADFANASVGVNATTWTITNGDAETRWAGIAPYITVGTCSMYPPGRVKTPPEFTPYPAWVDPVLDMFEAWGVAEFMIGETGIPVDKADQTTGIPVGTPDWTRRPRYMAELLQYIWDGCQARGLAFTAACYWNRQKAIVAGEDHPPNQFKHDRSKAPADTATTWYGWTPNV